MPLLSHFDTPASLRDMPAGSPFYANWSKRVSDEIGGLTGGAAGGGFYNPTTLDVQVAGEKAMTWMGFPRDLILPGSRDDKLAAYVAADADARRGRQNEYFEWRVDYQAGKLTRVTFVTEFRRYYQELWNLDPSEVVKLYWKILGNNNINEAHLKDSNGSYNIFNRWNTTDGIVHYIQSINTLRAAVRLCKESVDSPSPNGNNFEARPSSAGAPTSVDPRIAYDVNMLVRKGLFVTLRDPVGFYIAAWNNAGIAKPNGRPAPLGWWKIRRGKPGMVLRLVYEVPASEGFVLGDMTLGGRLIEYGGQLAERVSVAIHGTAGTVVRGGSNDGQ